MDLTRLRRRMPLLAFVLLAVLCLALLGFACACLSDQPIQAIERAVATPALVAPAELWTAFPAVLAAATLLLLAAWMLPNGRASPQYLQRFLI